MTPDLLDPNGQQVVAFTGKVHNLSRVAELTDSVIEIAVSGAWRDYRTAVGRQQWGEAELDYFLIACDLAFEDVSRVLAWNAESAQLAPMMDRTANSTQRRPLTEAAGAWHSPGGENLVDRARRLGWISTGGKVQTPIPQRARTRAVHGVTMDEHARRARARRLPAARRRQLDRIVKNLFAEVQDAGERRYLIDRLTAANSGRGQPTTTPAQLDAWRKDAEQLDWNAAALTARWGLNRSSTYKRLKKLRERP